MMGIHRVTPIWSFNNQSWSADLDRFFKSPLIRSDQIEIKFSGFLSDQIDRDRSFKKKGDRGNTSINFRGYLRLLEEKIAKTPSGAESGGEF